MSGQARERAAWFVAALVSAGVAMGSAAAMPLPFAASALTVMLAIVPGAWLVRRLAPGEGSDSRAAMALLLAPFAGGVLLVLPRIAGLSGGAAVRGLAIALALGSAWEALRPRRREASVAGDGLVWAGALFAGFVLAAAHAASPALSARSDGAFHAGVVWAAVRALPPEDPFFAGLPLRYAWGLHAWSAAWLELVPGLGSRVPLVVSSVLACVAALLAVGALARRLGASSRVGVFAQALALVGAAPGAWLVLVARALRGDVRGAAEFTRALESGADGALRALDPGLLHPSLVLPLDKFVVLTPFAWGLAGAAVLALAVDDAFARAGWRAWLKIVLVIGAVMFAHPLAGLALATSAACGVALAALRVPAARSVAVRVLLALACGDALMAPWLFAIAGADAGADIALGPARDLTGVLSVLFAGLCLLPFAAAHCLGRGERNPARLALGGALVALVLPAAGLHLGGENQSKFLNLALFLAAAPAAVSWSALARRPGWRAPLAAALAATLLPTLALMLWAYAHQSDSSADAPSRPPAAILSAVRELVPLDAVIVDAAQDTTRGAAPALPGETGHTQLWSGGFMARKWGNSGADLQARAVAAFELSHGRWPTGAEGAMLESLARAPWVIASDDSAHVTDTRWRIMARADGVVLARFAGRP